MDNQLGQVLDDVIVKEMTIDLSSGSFYKEVDDEVWTFYQPSLSQALG